MSISNYYFPEATTPSPTSSNPLVRQGKFLTELALPFISLYAPARTPLSYGLGVLNIAQSTDGFINGKSELRVQYGLLLAKGVADLAATYFQNRALLIANGIFELGQSAYNVYQAPSRNEKLLHLAKCLAISVHLLSVIQRNSLQWVIVSLTLQAASNFYQAYVACQAEKKPEEFRYEKLLTIVAKVAMGMIRLNQAQQIYNQMQAMEQLERQMKKIEAAESLENLPQKIEARRAILIDPVTGKKYDFGTFFHGYGKGLVKGSNLHFDRKVSDDGSVITELSFKTNRFYTANMSSNFETVKMTADQMTAFQKSLKGRVSIETPINFINLVDVGGGYGEEHLVERRELCPGEGNGVLIKINREELVLNVKVLLSRNFTHRPIKFFEMGSLEFITEPEKSPVIKVSLKGDQDIGAFQALLAAVGLDDAIQPSSWEDLEKNKLRFLFKTFYPLKVAELQQDSAFATLSPDELKQKMIALAPPMADHFKQYKVQPIEILPGYIRYSTPIDGKIYDLGGRALTAMLTESYDDDENDGAIQGEFPVDLNDQQLARVTNIVKHGLLSEHLRDNVGVDGKGLGGNGSVFTQMIWKRDLDRQKELEDLGYADSGIVRLYFSLKTLNRGSYQYNRDLAGIKNGPIYQKRRNVFDFMTNFPLGNKEARKLHELMIPDRILPEEIQGLSVSTELMREQIQDYFRKHQLIQVDSEGNETINNIPVREFISVDHRIPSGIINRCSKV